MLKLTIKDNEYKNLDIEKYFEKKEDLFKFFMLFVNPIDSGWLSIYLKQIGKDFTKDNIEFYYNEGFFDKRVTSWSGTIMNGLDNQDNKNFEYEMRTVEFTNDYKQPLAWGGNLSIAEVFPKNYKIIKEEFSKWIETIEEDCMDAYRIGLVNSEESMKEYQEFVSCCGSKDSEVLIEGEKYMFGCNFGH